MGQDSKIQWTNHTFNPWRGCSKVSAGCANCYAEKQAKVNPGVLGVWGDDGTRVIASEAKWAEPRRWNRAAEQAGVRQRVFCASMADVFEDRPELVAPRVRLFHLISETPWLDWLLLTKRPGNIRKFYGDSETARSWTESPPRNVWLGVSVENQQAADERIPVLLSLPATVRFLSCEPLLGPVDLSRWLRETDSDCPSPDSVCPECGGDVACDGQGPLYRCVEHSGIHIGCGWQGNEPDAYECPSWVIVGGESGRNARPCRVEWVRGLVRQCRSASVPVFVKQLGAVPTGDYYDDREFYENTGFDWPDAINWNHRDGQPPIGSRVELPLADPKGGNPDEWPEHLRVREFPR